MYHQSPWNPQQLDPSIEITGKLNSLKDSEHVEITEIFDCHGLLLCTTKDNRLVVWNPCTGQTRWIQSNKRCDRMCRRYFLGYENNKKSCSSYKILRFSLYFNDPRLVADIEIYEFNSDSWRVLDNFPYDWYQWSNLLCGVSLKGNTCWFDTDDSILMFDFTVERHGCLSLPLQIDYDNGDNVVLSVVREEKLAVLHQRFDIDSLEMKIWLTNAKIDEAKDLLWSVFLVVDFGKFMIQDMKYVDSFLVDKENKMVVCCDTYKDDELDEKMIKIYFVGEYMHKEVYKYQIIDESSYDSLLLSYVPSLVHIPHAT